MQAFSNYNSSILYLYFVRLIERNFGLRNCLPRLRTSSFDETVATSRQSGIACFAKFKIQSDGLISMRTTNILHFVSQDYVLRPTVPPIVFSFHLSFSYVFTGLESYLKSAGVCSVAVPIALWRLKAEYRVERWFRPQVPANRENVLLVWRS